MEKLKKQSFIEGATVLMASMILVKLIGAVFKIPIGNILTSVGMAYFNTSYQLFTTIYALTVTGFSAAVARQVAAFSVQGRYRDCRKVLHLGQAAFMTLGIGGALLMVLFAGHFSYLVKMPGARLSMIAMAPAIIFSCMMAAYRGYYEGLRNMVPTAVSQIVEVTAKLVFGLLFSYGVIAYARNQYLQTGVVFGTYAGSLENALSLALPYAAAAAMLGISVSTFAGFFYIAVKSRSQKAGFTVDEIMHAPKARSSSEIIRTLILTALPITLSAVALNLTNMIDVVTISNRLQGIYASNPGYFDNMYGQFVKDGQAMHELIYGSYTLTLPFFSIISAFTALFGKSALPNVTACFVKKDYLGLRRNIESVLRMTALISFPLGIGISVMSEDIIALFYPSLPEAVVLAAPSLRILGFAAVFLAFTTPVYAIFQGIGRFFLPLIFVLIGGMIKLAVNYYLVGILEVHIRGAATATLACYVTIILLSFLWLKKTTGIRLSYTALFIKPLIAAFCCGGTAYFVKQYFQSSTAGLAAAAAAAAAVYALLLFLLRAIPKYDLMMLPGGGKLCEVLTGLHLLK